MVNITELVKVSDCDTVIVKCCSILLGPVILTIADTVVVSIARTCKNGPDTCISKCC
jgi:hypothetical protein